MSVAAGVFHTLQTDLLCFSEFCHLQTRCLAAVCMTSFHFSLLLISTFKGFSLSDAALSQPAGMFNGGLSVVRVQLRVKSCLF